MYKSATCVLHILGLALIPCRTSSFYDVVGLMMHMYMMYQNVTLSTI